MDDIVPSLLEKIKKLFEQRVSESGKIKQYLLALENNQADYTHANKYAIEIGTILSDIFKQEIKADMLPDGKMYYNIAERILNETLKNNFDKISDYTITVQDILNKKANLGLKAQKTKINQNKIKGIINRVSSDENYENVSWLLDEPVIQYSQSIPGEILKANVEFQSKAGLKPKITRTISGHKPCEWCREIAGKYDYPDVPDYIYKRHERCRCSVVYTPGDGRRKNVWTKKYVDLEKLAERKTLNL